MHVGVSKITLRLPANQSLKGKRRVINSLCSRVRSKFDVSIAEVDNNDSWQLATLGIACASNSSSHADQAISSVIEFIERSRDDVEVVADERETLSGF
mgnify:CR=1 FL=1